VLWILDGWFVWILLGACGTVETTFSGMGVGEVNNLPNTNILENPFFHNFADIHKDLDCKYFDETSFTNSFNNSPTNFFAISMNIRSLPNKFTNLTNLLDRYRHNNLRPDLICLQEAWQANISSLNIENYLFFRLCAHRELGEVVYAAI